MLPWRHKLGRVLNLKRVFSGSRAAHRHAPSATRSCALVAALALPLTLNASEGLTATASQAHPAGAAAAPAGLPQAFAALQADLPDVSRPNDETRSVDVSSPKGTRTWTASSLSDNGLPSAARRAYVGAAQAMTGIDASCQLPWTLLAGIGRVESDHGRYGGSVLGRDGVSHPLIIGVPLNGEGPVAAIRDTDDGALDRDDVWDRAVGPMQFIPSTWENAARDADGDDVESPNDIDDAALAAAAYLCSGSGSVLGETAMRAAIYRYNASEDYVALVMAMERGYRTGVFIMPSITTEKPAEPPEHDKRDRRAHEPRGDEKPHGSAGTPSAPTSKPPGGPAPSPHNPPGGTSTAGGDGGKNGGPKPPPSPNPSPKPPPKPPPAKPPKLVPMSGALVHQGPQWLLDGTALDLGGQTKLAQRALADYDGDGTPETNQLELEGLLETGDVVNVVVRSKTLTVVSVQGLKYL
jgi:membrane-bound lytic murein transglycosylase B